jgi:nicotinate-nucleotide pyrophosphorylase (carboxylating)
VFASQILPVHPLQYERLLRRALEEDLGLAGDLTTNAIVPPGERVAGAIVARRAGCVAGLAVAARAFTLLDPEVSVQPRVEDGAVVEAGDLLAEVGGPARAVLTGERVALNVLGHLSGVATVTRGIVDAIAGTRPRVVCTRKTTPGMRALEKYAVRAGGGSNHRFGLDDAVLVKDNHLAIAGGVAEAVRRVRATVGHLVKVEVEVDDLDQLAQALACPIDAVLLDNMPPAMLRDAVDRVAGRVITEASGGITPQTARAVAESGVDLLSVGWITHSAPSLDVALDL